MKLGDKVAAVTSALKIPGCSRCRKRQQALNEVKTDQGILNVVKDVIAAVVVASSDSKG